MKYAFCPLLLLLRLILSGHPAVAQCPDGIQTYAVPLDSLSANRFSFLEKSLQDVRIVGFGEDTHGTADFTLLAGELLDYLSQNHGFTALALETQTGEAAFLNDYIHSRRDDLPFLLQNINSAWRYQTKEFAHLLQWMRDQNASGKRSLNLYGTEMLYVKHDAGRIKTFLSRVGHSVELTAFEKVIFSPHSLSEQQACAMQYFELIQAFDQHRERWIALTSADEYARARHHAVVLGQFSAALTEAVGYRMNDLRDLFMADNLNWALEQEGEKGKILIWAHNAHIGDWVANGGVDVMGHQLRKQWGEAYFSIATDFGSGDFYAFPHNANETGWKMGVHHFDSVRAGTFTCCLQSLGGPHTYVHLRAARTDTRLSCVLKEPLWMMYGAGATTWGTDTERATYGTAFDGIFYLNSTRKLSFLE